MKGEVIEEGIAMSISGLRMCLHDDCTDTHKCMHMCVWFMHACTHPHTLTHIHGYL